MNRWATRTHPIEFVANTGLPRYEGQRWRTRCSVGTQLSGTEYPMCVVHSGHFSLTGEREGALPSPKHYMEP
jgi:hypothetical protein